MGDQEPCKERVWSLLVLGYWPRKSVFCVWLVAVCATDKSEYVHCQCILFTKDCKMVACWESVVKGLGCVAVCLIMSSPFWACYAENASMVQLDAAMFQATLSRQDKVALPYQQGSHRLLIISSYHIPLCSIHTMMRPNSSLVVSFWNWLFQHTQTTDPLCPSSV